MQIIWIILVILGVLILTSIWQSLTYVYQCEKCKDTYEKLISSDSFIMEKLQSYKDELNIKPTNIENMNIEVKSKKGAKKDMRKYKNIPAVFKEKVFPSKVLGKIFFPPRDFRISFTFSTFSAKSILVGVSNEILSVF